MTGASAAGAVVAGADVGTFDEDEGKYEEPWGEIECKVNSEG